MTSNRLEVSGEVVEIAELRHTPAGIPVRGFTLKHSSQQIAAGMKRQVECEIPVLAMANLAEQAGRLRLGQAAKVAGFLNRKSLNSRQLVLHIDELEIIEKG